MDIEQIKLMIVEGKSNEEVMNLLGYKTMEGFKSFCRRNGISLSELRGKKIIRPHFNDNYLNNSDKLFYLLGLVASDGTVDQPPRNRVRICLKKDDKHILEEIKEFVFSNYNDIKLYDTKNKYLALHISDKNFVNKCLEFGITPCKTKTLKLKFENIPEIYKWSFIRGYFDGDGSARISQSSYKNKKYKKYKRATFVGGEYTMKQFSDFLSLNGIAHNLKNITSDKYSFNFFELDICKQKYCKLFSELLYKNSTIHLIRKFNILTENTASIGESR